MVKFNKPGATSEEMVAFFRDHCTPLVGKRTKKNAAFRYNKLPLVVVYYNADFSLQYREGSEFWRQKVLAVAQKYQKDKYHFAVADEEEFANELESVGLGDSGLEHNIVVFGYDGKKYPMDPNEFDGDFDENLEGFMKKISSGKAKPFVRSLPLPRDDKSAVCERWLSMTKVKTCLSSSMLHGVVIASLSSRFLWKWRKKFKKKQPNLVLAKFDATANDVPSPYKVEGFPTIYFAPSGHKSEPFKYELPRTKVAITSYLKQKAVKSFQHKEEL
ncbi:hypothetical protein KIN20_002926 [Parelaphostrongylus tenuis]|uniref:Thioredoxin domain-containing protein n=1 Tax=Parelaphostrongylus tenuis TaxID=148309 RepID=A0AAD5QDA7_PARTN|nr:hypothetical protein KIN20_002926 [Parelaphostrongylus tenuis]